ncbi:RHS repeat-associated core domain-containing protein [Paludibacterium purpuratum]|uniref:RHS repeat-associated protein n=1 Tax=Paludibacterium purpuratum TaxID=1144873 RepID=A0A4R7B525_9NEIS|nr:RHS repeat-associated core domain-containing protein [Paludibacterium purpuratum]TDR79691.1 RHS repeat-associated protein [Paludibacterium purpuratum]
MPNQSDFYSQAYNFASATQGHVDPRTGLFTLNFPLAELTGNDALGPELPLALNYSPLSPVNAGFGIGCVLGLTQYDRGSRLLSLASGERYKVQESGSTVTLRQNVVRGIRFEKFANGYQVTYKSGHIEWLAGPDTTNAIHVPIQLISPLGHYLTLEWDRGKTPPRLTAVRDMTGRTLLTIHYPDPTTIYTTVQVWPDSPDEGYTIQLAFKSSYLDTVQHLAAGLLWRFGYDTSHRLTTVTAPTGLVERAEYQENVHKFPPASNLPALPAVFRHTLTPGADQPNIVTTYSYDSNNYLGYEGSGSGSWNANEDYLYSRPTSYTYWTRATCDGAVTQRTYNCYHLQIEESITDQRRVRTTSMRYDGIRPGAFDTLPAWFQSPTRTTIVYDDRSQTTLPPRSEDSSAAYDDWGNLIRQTAPDGTVTEWVYYPPEGESGAAPAEPNGFQRLVKSQTVTPPANLPAAPTQLTRYRYDTLATLSTSQAHMPANAALPIQEDTLSGTQWLTRRRTIYQTDTANPEFGRVTRIEEDRYPEGATSEEAQSFRYTRSYTFARNGDQWTQTETDTTHDRLTITSAMTLSRLSGRQLATVDAQGNTVDYTYDTLGRVLTATAQRGGAYQATVQYAYSIDTAQGNRPLTVVTDPKGNQSRTWYDGLGRAVRQAVKAQDDADWHDSATNTFDARGRALRSDVFDIVPNPNRRGAPLPLTSRTTQRYDGWDQVDQLTGSVGDQLNTATDAVAMTVATQLTGSRQGREVTHYTLQRLPDTVTRYTHDGTEQGQIQQRYDGLGRQLAVTDELGRETRYDYDAWGRVATQTLPDGTVVTRRYAPDSGGADWVTEILVNGVSQGTQTFDGLGRLTASSNGGRTTRLEYADAASPVPSKLTQPDGSEIRYRYVKELDNALAGVAAGTVAQAFDYDKQTGALLSAEETGSHQRRLSYSPLGLMQDETFQPTGGTSRQARYGYTPNGLPLDYTDIAGVTQTTQYNDRGQVVRIADGDVAVDIVYDDIGRLDHWTATDVQSGQAMTTTLGYDDFNRENQRTLVCGDDNWIFSQSYALNGQVSRREVRRNNAQWCSETFEYDRRNRLQRYSVDGNLVGRPHDAYGQSIVSQTFEYDALDNVTQVATTFLGGDDTATFHYDNADKNQLSAVTHSHEAYPARIELRYDGCGRLVRDEAGRTLGYDALGRLAQIAGGGRYLYDGTDRLVAQAVQNGDTRELYYDGDTLVNLVTRESGANTRLIHAGGHCVAERRAGTTALTGSDAQGSVRLARQSAMQQASYSYAPYGYRPSDTQDLTVLGFNGELLDPVSGSYHLGNGTRAYNPILMRFNTPDGYGYSPFGAGGLNPYAYCAGDPINRSDPSGHLSWKGWAGIGLAVAGMALTVASAGALGPVMATVTIAAGLISGATGIASIATKESNPEASSILGWISLGSGLASAAGGMVQGARAEHKALKGARKAYGLVDDIAEESKAPGRRTLGGSRAASSEPVAMSSSVERVTYGNFEIYSNKGYAAPNRAVLTAHGMKPLRPSTTHLPRGTTIRYAADDGAYLLDPGLERIGQRRYTPRETITGPREIGNYNLYPYHSDTPLEITRALHNSFDKDYHIIAVRDRGVVSSVIKPVDTNQLLKTLKQNNLHYRQIDAVHCRVSPYTFPWAATQSARPFYPQG